MNKCIFLDRDGVINLERGDYTYHKEDFKILPGVVDSLKKLKEQGYLLIVVTNQAGISRGIYSRDQMYECHSILQQSCGHIIDDIYYCPYHPTLTESIARKPGTLMFERAIAKYNIDTQLSWMVGDRERDLIPAEKLGMKTILVSGNAKISIANYMNTSLEHSVPIILK